MHVLVIPSWFAQYPGDPSGSFFATQAAGVWQLGEQVGIIYPDIRAPYQRPWHIRETLEWSVSAGVHLLRGTYTNWTPRIEPLIMPRWLSVGMRLFDAYCARFGKPDVIHAHCLLRAGVLASRISRKYDIPYVVTEHSSDWHKHDVSEYELRLARSAAKSASTMISVSAALISHLRQDLELDRSYVVPNAVDPHFLDGVMPQRAFDGNLAFINVGLLNPGKRQDLLIDAFHLAFGKDTKNTLSIVGDGPERNALAERIARYGMDASIRLLGMQPKAEVARLLGESNCLALTSDHETFGVVVIEALATGMPVISTDCGGTADIVTDTNGIVTEKGNVQAIAAAMTTMRERIAAGRYDRNQIRQDCLDRFSQQSVCTRLVKIYEEVAR